MSAFSEFRSHRSPPPARDTTMGDSPAAAQEKSQDSRPKYKSFRKKFRKMMHVFDEKMYHSNALYTQEQKAEQKAKKLAQENDRLLDLLLDVNDSAQISADKRFDLNDGVPALSAVPPLVSDDKIAAIEALQTPEGQELAEEVRAILKEKEAAREHATEKGPRPPKPLSLLLATVPHINASSPLISSELLASLENPEGHDAPYSYLTPEQLDEYLNEIDASMGDGRPARKKEEPELMLRNPNSAYNWLRKHRPDCFLQDGEGTEKAQGKPGALRGAGKRASLPAPSKPDALEFVEEDGIGYDAHLAGPLGKGKRKREDGDDGTYHPKAGKTDETGAKAKKPRQARKKKSDGSEEATSSKSSRKGKKGKASSPGIADESFAD
ncbi:hypothetical protein LSUE1_G007400 [Lachnellula suecica]|uniref:Uncharacterized protein n=1 Tax=Lachnellula suecica TaxID=602035 RepID=A0A8T9C713_9HELO|nr:hypothetical protein LSUE1_G007400 [Lachnellula suecica]